MDYRRWLRLRAQSPDEAAREIDEELEAHVAMRAEELARRGDAPQQAQREALRRFGDYEEARATLIQAARERHGRRRRHDWLEALWQDVLYALRRARNAPGYTAFAILILATGIGLTTSTFTVLEGVLIRSLPYADADRIYGLTTLDSLGNEVVTVAQANFVDWKQQSRTLDAVALYSTIRLPVGLGDDAVRATTTYATGDFFRVLQPPMVMGRPYSQDEAQTGAAGVVVSEAFWRTGLASAPLPLQITLGTRTADVIGVMRAGYEFPAGTEIWAAERDAPGTGMQRNYINYQAIARIRDGVTEAQANAELDEIAERIRRQDPIGLYSHGIVLNPLKDQVVGQAGTYLPILMGAVVFVLLIACANLAGVNLARGSTRTREMAVRAALGAGRVRLIRQLLVEHLLLALLGGAFGVLLAWWIVRAGTRFAAGVVPRVGEVSIDPGVVGFAALIAVLCGVLTGTLPALLVSRTGLSAQMGNRGTVRGGRMPGALLVGLEVAASLVLLTGGLLLVRSYRALLDREMGFDANAVIVTQVTLPQSRYTNLDAAVDYWERLTSELRTLPAVEAVGATAYAPLGTGAMTFVEIEGVTAPNNGTGYRVVGEDFFRALGVPLLAGRTIERTDTRGTERVAVVNRTMAEQFWPGQNPIGKRLRVPVTEAPPGQVPPWITVVGITGDFRHWGIYAEVGPEVYVAYRQRPFYTTSMNAVVRVRGPVQPVMDEVRAALRRVDPHVPGDVTTLATRLSDTLRVRQLGTLVLSMFALLALLLAALGLYSLLAFAVSQRTREIAVRVALGAREATLLRMVLWNGLSVVALGTLAGLFLAFALTRLMSTMLVQVSPLDPLTFVLVTVGLLVVASLASLIPALRATRVNPLIALNAG